MMIKRIAYILAISIAISAFGLITPAKSRAGLDTMDGPIIKAARKALNKNQVNLVIIWLPEEYSGDIKNVFKKTMTVRKLGAEAKELADMYFFETVMRLHAASEGQTYTGIKESGMGSSLLMSTADQAFEDGSLKSMYKILMHMVRESLRDRFVQVMAKRGFNTNELDKGRAYVKAYTEFIECLDNVYESLKKPATSP